MQKIFFILLVLISCSVFAQEIPRIEIDSDYNELPFNQLVHKLDKEHNIKILCKHEWASSIKSIKVDNKMLLSEYLNRTLLPFDLQYMNYQDYWVIIPGKKQSTVKVVESDVIIIGDPLEKGKYKLAKISGHVFDGKTKTPIPGAQIICEKLSIAGSTDENGAYSIELPVGEHKLRFSFIGLNDEFRQVLLHASGLLDMELYEKNIALDQINVNAERPENNYRSTSMGMVKLDMKAINKLSVLMGEPDVIKSMVMLPGVQSTGENASGFNVRGGNIDQNLILVHETPVYNTSHLFGLFSMLDASLVKDVTLYKSGMPSRYGGRIASVMNIELNKGQKEKLKVNGGLGIINSRLSVEGPLGDKITFLFGGRTTYSDWMLGIIKNYEIQNSSTYFYDFNTKIDFEINKKNRISLFGYGSNDYFNYFENAEYEYGNLLGSAKWNHIFNNNNSGNLSINFSKYNANVGDFNTKGMEYKLNTSIEQEQISYHFSSNQISRHNINTGFNAFRYLIEPGSSTPYSNNSIAPTINLSNEQAFEVAAYVEDEFDMTPELAIIGGIRFSNFWLTGPDEINRYIENAPRNEETYLGKEVYVKGVVNYFNGFEPRLALRYELENSSSLKIGYNRTMQYIQQISNSASITPADFWKASDTYIMPLISDQYAIGYFQNFKNNMYESSFEIYYKNIQNILDYKNGAQIVLNKNLDQMLISGLGKAYGTELLIKKNKGSLTGWLAYTYSRSFKKVKSTFAEETINKGQWYKSNYDKPHDLTFALNYKLSRRFSVASNFTYSTGRPVTLPEQKFTFSSYETVSYSERNKYRIPDYHRLDLSITYGGSLKKKQKWRNSWTFAIYNVYGRNNAFSVFYEKQKPSNINNYQAYALYKFAIIGVPVPSFTYNFWF